MQNSHPTPPTLKVTLSPIFQTRVRRQQLSDLPQLYWNTGIRNTLFTMRQPPSDVIRSDQIEVGCILTFKAHPEDSRWFDSDDDDHNDDGPEWLNHVEVRGGLESRPKVGIKKSCLYRPCPVLERSKEKEEHFSICLVSPARS